MRAAPRSGQGSEAEAIVGGLPYQQRTMSASPPLSSHVCD